MWRLATGCDYRTLRELFGMGRSTVCESFQEFITAVVLSLKDRYLRRPSEEEFINIMQGYRDVWGFPQCCGAIDGTHIPIVGPKEHKNDYYNRKGWYSMICQAICDHRYRFWDIEVGWPGKVHDARVFANSAIFRDGDQGTLFPDRPEQFGNTNVPPFIIGDPAYPLLSWLMKGYPEGPGTPDDQRHFNYRLSRARMTIECAFGRLKSRWRILRKQIENETALVPNIVVACCILHNICEARGEVIDIDNDNMLVQPQRDNAGQAAVPAARTACDALCARLHH